MKVVIAGAGIAGNCMLRQLRHHPQVTSLKAYEQRSCSDASPPGLNVVMNHNGMAAIQEIDPELYELFLRTRSCSSKEVEATAAEDGDDEEKKMVTTPEDVEEKKTASTSETPVAPASASSSSEMNNWSARTVSGKILYHLPNVVASGDAATPAMVAQWDHIHSTTRCDDLTEYNTQVVDVQEDGLEKVKIKILRKIGKEENGEYDEEWIFGIDLLIAADGRYSKVREQLAPTTAFFGPPYIADFRLVIHHMKDIDEYLTVDEPMWRVYNRPLKDKILKVFVDECKNSEAMMIAASNHVRVGIMKLREECLGVFGNIAIPPEPKDEGDGSDGSGSDGGSNGNGASYYDDIKRADFMAALFECCGDDDDDSPPPDKIGQMVIQMLRNHGQDAHWTRKQETDTCYQALDGRVLFLGDAAGAIYPTLGQGANL